MRRSLLLTVLMSVTAAVAAPVVIEALTPEQGGGHILSDHAHVSVNEK